MRGRGRDAPGKLLLGLFMVAPATCALAASRHDDEVDLPVHEHPLLRREAAEGSRPIRRHVMTDEEEDEHEGQSDPKEDQRERQEAEEMIQLAGERTEKESPDEEPEERPDEEAEGEEVDEERPDEEAAADDDDDDDADVAGTTVYSHKGVVQRIEEEEAKDGSEMPPEDVAKEIELPPDSGTFDRDGDGNYLRQSRLASTAPSAAAASLTEVSGKRGASKGSRGGAVRSRGIPGSNPWESTSGITAAPAVDDRHRNFRSCLGPAGPECPCEDFGGFGDYTQSPEEMCGHASQDYGVDCGTSSGKRFFCPMTCKRLSKTTDPDGWCGQFGKGLVFFSIERWDAEDMSKSAWVLEQLADKIKLALARVSGVTEDGILLRLGSMLGDTRVMALIDAGNNAATKEAIEVLRRDHTELEMGVVTALEEFKSSNALLASTFVRKATLRLFTEPMVISPKMSSEREAREGVLKSPRFADAIAKREAAEKAASSGAPGVPKEGDVRLFGGSETAKNGYGRLEVFHDGAWGTVCNDGVLSSVEVVNVACTHLGYNHGSIIPLTDVGKTDDPIWLRGLSCTGHEATIWNCTHEPLGHEEKPDPAGLCSHSGDLAIQCEAAAHSDHANLKHVGSIATAEQERWEAMVKANEEKAKAKEDAKAKEAKATADLADFKEKMAMENIDEATLPDDDEILALVNASHGSVLNATEKFVKAKEDAAVKDFEAGASDAEVEAPDRATIVGLVRAAGWDVDKALHDFAKDAKTEAGSDEDKEKMVQAAGPPEGGEKEVVEKAGNRKKADGSKASLLPVVGIGSVAAFGVAAYMFGRKKPDPGAYSLEGEIPGTEGDWVQPEGEYVEGAYAEGAYAEGGEVAYDEHGQPIETAAGWDEQQG